MTGSVNDGKIIPLPLVMYSQPVNVVSMHHERHRRQHNKQIKHVMLTRMINALNSLHDPYNTDHNL